MIYDPRAPAVIADPHPALRRLRETEPVHKSEVLGGWVLTRYDDVKAALVDKRMSADRMRPFFEHLDPKTRARVTELEALLRPWAVFNDPPAHGRLRAALSRAVTPATVEAMAPRIERLVADLLDRALARGRMDVIADFAYPLPATVVMLLLGVPLDDLERVKGWSDELALFVGSSLGTADKYDRAERAARELRERFRGLVAERRRTPRDDVLSALAHEGLTDDEVIATAVLLLFAGHETTTHLIANGVLLLMRHPEEHARLLRGECSAATAVEEVLRFEPPGAAMVRVAREAFELHGHRIARGARIFAMIMAANRDPDHFENADALDLGRRDNRHLTFGFGSHFCIGAALARLEGRIALEALTKTRPRLAVDERELEWTDGLVLRGLRSLPIELSYRA